MLYQRIALAILASVWFPLSPLAATAPESPPRASAFAFGESPVIDGRVLNDLAWRAAPAISGFWQIEPDEGSPATQKTEVFVGYSEDTLYVGVICYDKEPDRIIVTDSRRDSSLAETDSFQFIIDGLKDGQNGLIFGTNPAGIEYDAQVTKEGTGSFGSSGGEFNLNWDTSWQVKTRIDETGWQAEFAIPFKSLRYGAGPVQTWGMNFQRNIRRNNEVSFWSPLSRQHNLHRVSEAGSVTDIQPPHQRSLKFTPYGVGKRISIKYTRAMINAALDGKLENVEFKRHLPFKLNIPTTCPDVPAEILDPINTWSDPTAYRDQAHKLREMFAKNFEKYEVQVDSAVREVAL